MAFDFRTLAVPTAGLPPSSISIRRRRYCRAVARIRRQRRRDQRIDHRRDRGDRAHCAVHRRARRCSRPQTTDHGFDVCHRGADADHEFRVKRAATRVLALRSGDAAAADLHRHCRLYRRRMAAGRGDPGRRALYFGIELSAAFAAGSFPASSPTCSTGGPPSPPSRCSRSPSHRVAVMLPRERHFVRSAGLPLVTADARHLRNPRLLAIYAVGFGVLFNFISVFTYVNFHLAAPPYLFSPTLLGALFVTYLPAASWCPGSGAASRCSAAAASCLALSPSGSPALFCCSRRRSALLSPGSRCAPPAGCCARPFRPATSSHRQGGALVRRRPLRLDLLHRRQRRRVPHRVCLERRWLDRLRRDDPGDAADRRRDRRSRLGAAAI